MDYTETINVLNGLIQTCRDGQEGFREASENVTRHDLKELFAHGTMERAQFCGELQKEVLSLGGDPENTGSVAGAVHRAWIDIKGTLTGKDDTSILNECERGEDAAVEAYRKAIADGRLPANLRVIVDRQAVAVKAMHDRIRSQRDLAAHA